MINDIGDQRRRFSGEGFLVAFDTNAGVNEAMGFDPKTLRYGTDGVPILKAQEIENVATEVLQKYCPHVLRNPAMTPIMGIIESLGETTGLRSTVESLGYKGRAKILGKVSFSKKLLTLDTDLTKEREKQLRFTAAHEIGHWILHRWNHKKWKFKTGTHELEDDEETLCRLDERTPQDWLEWQANIFAASLVMPRATFQRALVATQNELNITKNVGEIWISDAEYSQRDFNLVGNRLANLYGVSLTSIRVRLNTLKLLHDESRITVRSVSGVLSSRRLTK